MADDITYTFSFGHHIFNIPYQWLSYYPWLQSMFGISTSYSNTQELDTNMIHYLSHVPPYKIRLMINAFEDEMNGSNIQRRVRRQNLSNHVHYVKLMESFLKHGPGCTRGLDVLYKCKNCGEETYETRNDVNAKKRIQHKLERLSEHSLVCVYCGHIWCSLVGNSHNQVFCTQIKASGCDHIWETCN